MIDIKFSNNFRLHEFVKSETAKKHKLDNSPNEDQIINLWILTYELLQPLREKINTPIIITSGYRCPELNKQVGGSRNSQHMQGKAADFVVPQKDLLTVFDVIRYGYECDTVILEFGRWIHLSYDKGNNRGRVMKASKENGQAVYKHL